MFPSVYVMDLGVIFPAIFWNNVPGTCLQGIGCGEDSGYNYYNFNQGKKKNGGKIMGKGVCLVGVERRYVILQCNQWEVVKNIVWCCL